MLASRGQRKRWLEATQVLIGDRKFSEPSWPDLVDGLSPERASRCGSAHEDQRPEIRC
jgi:hypothetical protein